jgi:hypothetical protein
VGLQDALTLVEAHKRAIVGVGRSSLRPAEGSVRVGLNHNHAKGAWSPGPQRWFTSQRGAAAALQPPETDGVVVRRAR